MPSPPPSSPRRRDPRAATGVFATWIRFAIISVIAVVQAPILFRYIPPVELGVWYLLFAVANFVALSDLGLPTALSRAVSFRWGRESAAATASGTETIHIAPVYLRASVHEIYASALTATVLLSLVAALVALPVASLYFRHTLAAEPLDAGILGPLVVFLGGIVLNLTASIPCAYLQGTGDVAWDSAVRTVVQIAGLVALWIIVPHAKSLMALCWIYLAQGGLLVLGSQALLWWRHRELSLWDARPRLDVIRTMYGESLPFFVSRVGVWLTLEATLLIGAYFLGSGRIADFAVLRQIVMMGAGLTTAITSAASPHVSAAHAAYDRERVHGLYLGVVRYTLIVNTLWAVGTLFWAESVLNLLVGPGHFLGYAVLVPLTIGAYLGYHAGAHGTLTWSIGKWPFAPVTLAGGVLNIALTALGGAYFGFPGLALGPTVAELLTVDWIQVGLALRSVGIPVREFLRGTAVRALGYAAAFFSAAGLIRWAWVVLIQAAPSGWATAHPVAAAAAGICTTAAVGSALAWFVGMTSGDRAYFASLVRRR
jgi:O-antigen/teichoic acid export membrane protein